MSTIAVNSVSQVFPLSHVTLLSKPSSTTIQPPAFKHSECCAELLTSCCKPTHSSAFGLLGALAWWSAPTPLGANTRSSCCCSGTATSCRMCVFLRFLLLRLIPVLLLRLLLFLLFFLLLAQLASGPSDLLIARSWPYGVWSLADISLHSRQRCKRHTQLSGPSRHGNTKSPGYNMPALQLQATPTIRMSMPELATETERFEWLSSYEMKLTSVVTDILYSFTAPELQRLMPCSLGHTTAISTCCEAIACTRYTVSAKAGSSCSDLTQHHLQPVCICAVLVNICKVRLNLLSAMLALHEGHYGLCHMIRMI